MTSKNKQKEKFELPEDEFSPKNVKERITIFLDQDILDDFRAKAKSEGSKYQTLINQALRASLGKSPLESRLAAIEKQIKKFLPG